MDAQILLGLLLTVLPAIELRGGLPVVMDYVIKNNLSIWPYFILVLILNILVIFLAFLFFDFLHERLLKIKLYRRGFGKVIERAHRKSKKVQTSGYPYLMLLFFVAIPLPLTGAWTGTIVSWLLGMDRRKSFVAISLGVFVAGLIILFASASIFSWFY